MMIGLQSAFFWIEWLRDRSRWRPSAPRPDWPIGGMVGLHIDRRFIWRVGLHRYGAWIALSYPGFLWQRWVWAFAVDDWRRHDHPRAARQFGFQERWCGPFHFRYWLRDERKTFLRVSALRGWWAEAAVRI